MPRTQLKGAVLAPWWKRAVAYFIDLGILCSTPVIVSLPFFLLGAMGGGFSAAYELVHAVQPLITLMFFVLAGASIWNYVVIQGKTGRSWGKVVMGLRLVSVHDGRPIGWAPSLGRALLRYLVDSCFLVGFVVPWFTDKRQTISDLCVNSIVVDDRRPVPPEATSFRKRRPPVSPADFGQPVAVSPAFRPG